MTHGRWDEPQITQGTLAAWRAQLVQIRVEERQRYVHALPETGRLLEIVGQALAQGGGSLPADDITRIEELTSVVAVYQKTDQP
ncbi:MAG: hypothetical protein U0031_14995 [Thermomicrobiales bacterium]